MKKTWTKGFAVLMALVLLAGLLPAAAAADSNKIQEINLDDMAWPTVGSRPQFYIDDSEYEQFEIDRDQYGRQHIDWYHDDPRWVLEPASTFIAGHEYILDIALRAKGDYRFDIKERIHATIGGKEVLWSKPIAGGYYCKLSVKWTPRKPVEGRIEWACTGYLDDPLTYRIIGDLEKLDAYTLQNHVKAILERSEDGKNWELWRDNYLLGNGLHGDGTTIEHYIRMTLYPDAYTGLAGSLTSPPLKTYKNPCTTVPVRPQLSTGAPYSYIGISNCQSNQEYTWSYTYVEDPDTLDWKKNSHLDRYPDNEAYFTDMEMGRNVYVYTRVKEDPLTQAGKKIEYSSILLNETSYLQHIELEGVRPPREGYMPIIYLPINSTTTFTVLPQPANANSWSQFTFKDPREYGVIAVYPEAPVIMPDMPKTITVQAGDVPGDCDLEAYYHTYRDEQYGAWRVNVYDPKNVTRVSMAEPLRIWDVYLPTGKTFQPYVPENILLPAEANDQFVLRWRVITSYIGIGSATYGTENDYISVDPKTGAVTAKKPMDSDTPDYFKEVQLYAKKGNIETYLHDGSFKVITEEPLVIPVESLKITPSRVMLSRGEDIYLQADVFPSYADPGELTWKSDQVPSIMVDSKGRVSVSKYSKIGEVANITVTAENGVSGTCTVIVCDGGKMPFVDVPEDAWYYHYVEKAWKKGLMNGHTPYIFGPEENLSRAQLAQILYNKEEKPEVTAKNNFTDVKEGDWFCPAVTWAASKGYVGGYGGGLFGPEDPITREQLATILWRYAGKPKTSGSLDAFRDKGKVDDWAETALKWAVEKKIMGGKGDGILDPLGNATRAEVAKMIMCYVENVEP